jgi:hypothetical protein
VCNIIKIFYGCIILFLDFELTPMECSLDSFIQHDMFSSSTTVLYKNHDKYLQVLVVFTLTNHKMELEKLLSIGEARRIDWSIVLVYDLGACKRMF